MENVEIETIQDIEVANILQGDRVIWAHTWEDRGVTITTLREGDAFQRDSDGDWETFDGGRITDSKLSDARIRVHRRIQNPPNENGRVIVPADSRIVAELGGKVWTALEAICGNYGSYFGQYGVYYGVWRSGKDVRTFVYASDIQPGTWRLDKPSEETPF